LVNYDFLDGKIHKIRTYVLIVNLQLFKKLRASWYYSDRPVRPQTLSGPKPKVV